MCSFVFCVENLKKFKNSNYILYNNNFNDSADLSQTILDRAIHTVEKLEYHRGTTNEFVNR